VYCDAPLHQSLAEQGTMLYRPIKKPEDQELAKMEKYYDRLVRHNWPIDKIDIQNARPLRSTGGFMLHCFEKLTFAFYLLFFNL